METEMGIPIQDEDPDRRPTTLLGRIRRFFDRGRGSDSHWHDWWDNHPGGGAWFHGGGGGSHWGDWGGCDGGSGCGGGGCGSAGCGGGCGGGGCGSC